MRPLGRIVGLAKKKPAEAKPKEEEKKDDNEFWKKVGYKDNGEA